MKQIGEFAKENGVTIKALHHYEKLGLVLPAKVDEFTGYRYYDENQSDTLAAIAYLKSLGLSLSEVKKIVDGDMASDKFISFLRAKKKQAQVDIGSSQHRYQRISVLIKLLENKNVSGNLNIKEIISMEKQNKIINMTGRELFNLKSRRMVENAGENNEPLCAISVDIDNFHSVNTDFGYEMGDIVIERIQNAIESALLDISSEKGEDYSVMERLGGDEFKIVVCDSVDVCTKFADKIIANVKAIDYGDVADGIAREVTIGIASNEFEKLSTGKLFHLAESAMYDAKVHQKGGYKVFEE